MTATAPTATIADFQAEWYLALLVFAVILVAALGFWMALKPVGAMWRAGDHGLAWVVSAACGVTLLLFLAMFLQVAIGLLPGVG